MVSLKETTTREVERLKREQLQESVSQLDAQINTLNHRWATLERFVKRWWVLIATITSIVAAIFGAGIWAITTYNSLEKKADADSSFNRLNKRIDELKHDH